MVNEQRCRRGHGEIAEGMDKRSQNPREGVLEARKMRMFATRLGTHLKHDRQDHQPRAMSRRYQKRPDREIAKSYLHSAPSEVAAAEQLEETEQEQRAGDRDLQINGR